MATHRLLGADPALNQILTRSSLVGMILMVSKSNCKTSDLSAMQMALGANLEPARLEQSAKLSISMKMMTQ